LSLLTAGAWLELDLLRRRRDELGLMELSSLPVGKLLRQGGAIGGGVLAVALLLLIVVAVQWQMAVKRRGELTPVAMESDKLQAEAAAAEANVASTQALNRAIADAVAGVRSGSALLTELQRLAPEGVRFQLLTTKGNTLELEGDVQEPLAVRTLNAFQLQLDASSFFEPDGFALERADRGTDEQIARMTFRFSGEFAPDAVEATRRRLAALGTPGLAARTQRLEREGLLP